MRNNTLKMWSLLLLVYVAVADNHLTTAPTCCQLGQEPLIQTCDTRVQALGNNSCADEYETCCQNSEIMCCERGFLVDGSTCEDRVTSDAISYCLIDNTFTSCCECCETGQAVESTNCFEASLVAENSELRCPRASVLACCTADENLPVDSSTEAAYRTAGLNLALTGNCGSDTDSITGTYCECCLYAKQRSEETCTVRVARITENSRCRTAFESCCEDPDESTQCFLKGLLGFDEHRDCEVRAQALGGLTSSCSEIFIDACSCCERGRTFEPNDISPSCEEEMASIEDDWCRRAFQACCSNADGRSSQDGDPHFVTFDGAKISYQGPCRYVLTETDPRYLGSVPPFTITAKNSIHTDLASYLDDVEVTIGERSLLMNVRGNIFVDGQLQSASFQDGTFKVHRDVLQNVLPRGPKRALSEPALRLETSILVNLTVTVQRPDGKGRYYLNIEVPKMYRGKLTGLGGNFNGDPMDDYRLSDGRDVRNIWPVIFRSQMIADSWLVKDDPVNLKTGHPCTEEERFA